MSLANTFQDLVAQVPDFVQPLIVAAAGAVPFIEGEGAAAIGIIGGINPVIAAVAAIIGNFVCVAVLVALSSRARGAIVSRHRTRSQSRENLSVSGAPLASSSPRTVQIDEGTGSRRHEKFQRAFERYGVPGVSLLGPLLLPTQFTATMLAAAGIGKARILAWQGIAIIGWTTIVAVLVTGVASAIH